MEIYMDGCRHKGMLDQFIKFGRLEGSHVNTNLSETDGCCLAIIRIIFD